MMRAARPITGVPPKMPNATRLMIFAVPRFARPMKFVPMLNVDPLLIVTAFPAVMRVSMNVDNVLVAKLDVLHVPRTAPDNSVAMRLRTIAAFAMQIPTMTMRVATKIVLVSGTVKPA